jgi:hypothetical protein
MWFNTCTSNNNNFICIHTMPGLIISIYIICEIDERYYYTTALTSSSNNVLENYGRNKSLPPTTLIMTAHPQRMLGWLAAPPAYTCIVCTPARVFPCRPLLAMPADSKDSKRPSSPRRFFARIYGPSEPSSGSPQDLSNSRQSPAAVVTPTLYPAAYPAVLPFPPYRVPPFALTTVPDSEHNLQRAISADVGFSAGFSAFREYSF